MQIMKPAMFDTLSDATVVKMDPMNSLGDARKPITEEVKNKKRKKALVG